MSQRVNIILEQSVWDLFKTVPQGERSRLVNFAIKDWFEQKKSKRAAQKMDALRQTLPSFSSKEILNLLRADRNRQ